METSWFTYNEVTGQIVLMCMMGGRIVPYWAWDSWDEVDVFIAGLAKLKEDAKCFGDRGIPQKVITDLES